MAEIIDLSGYMKFRAFTLPEKPLLVNTFRFQNGIYLIKITAGQKFASEKLVIVK
jgi:hypothetical protein